MVQLWIPAAELKADLEDQARKRLEEIEREAERRRNQIMQAGQDKLNDQRVQSAMTRFNEMVDPLLAKGDEALQGAASGIQDTSERARQLVEEAQRSIQNAPTLPGLDGFGLDGQTRPPQPQAQTPPSPIPDETTQPSTPPSPSPASPQIPVQQGVSDLMGGITGALNGLGQPQPPTSPTPAAPPPPAPLPPEPGPEPMTPPAFPGGPGGAPPPPPPGFTPPGLPGAGLGSALADRIRGGMDAAGQGIGDKVTEGRDQAMELANKSLDIARDAMNRGGERFEQTPIARAVTDANSFRPPGLDGTRRPDPFQGVTDSLAGFREANAQGRGLDAIRDAALPLLTGPSAASQTAEAIAPWTPEMQRNQEAWEGYQGQEREGAGLSGLLSGAAAAARRYEQQTREQGETLLGKGTQGEGPLEQAQAAFGYSMAPYGALPEIARGGVEEATGSPLAGAAAYGAASILGPGGIAKYLRESGPVALRMLTNPRVVPELLKNDRTGALKALALATIGGVGGTGWGLKTGLDAIREGATPQEAAAQAVTAAADLLQISEAAGIPIEAAARVRRLLPGGLRPGQLPPPPGMEGGLPGAPGAPERPGAPVEPPAARPVEPSLPEERPLPEEPLSPEDGARGLDGVAPAPRRPRTFAEIESAPGERLTPLPEEPVSRARQYQQEREVADEAVARAEARRGPLDTARRFAENLTGDQGNLGVLFGNAPTTAVVGRGDEARRVGAIEQTIGGPAGAAPQGVTGAEGEALRPGRVIPETEISRFGQIRRGAETISPETGALTGTIEDRLLREYRKHDLTADEEKALGVGAPGGPGGLAGEPRVASFRHPGWMARNYTPDYDAKLMRFEVPDKEAMAELHPTWKPHLRTGKKGAYQYTEIKPKKGQSALDAFEDTDEAAPASGKGAPKGTKVLYDTATGDEINITRHPDMPWKQGQAPITDTTGMTRDGRLEEIASTPLSYQRAALLRGLGLRNFYPDYGRFFGEDLARNSKTLFKELNAIFGAVASQASPETNLQRALAVMSAGRDFYMRNGRPPDFNELTVLTSTNFDGNRMRYTDTVTDADLGRFPAGGITGADVQKVIDIWDKGASDIGAGWKTPVFGQNLESGALNRADPLSVPDTHMFRGRGHTMTGGGPSQSVNSDLRALGITNATVVRLADEFGLTPFQVQSALWFVYKNELAPFNATDKAQIRNKAGTSDEASPAYLAEAAKHDPWPKAMEEGPDGQPRVMTVPGPDGKPMDVRQGTLPAVLRHVANVAGRFPAQVKGQPKVARPRMDLMKAFRDLDAEFAQKVGRDSLTEAAGDARLTFNGKLVGDPSRGGTVDLQIPGEGTKRVRSMEITPENVERAAFKLSQEAPVAIVPVDGLDGEGLGRLGYDSQRGQIEALREASIPHEVVLTNRPFTAGEPGKAETQNTARIIFPGASLDTARYAASLLGQRAGADEVAVSWPTRPGAGRLVVSIEHPEGLEWTTEEIAKYPWASTLVGRANVSPDGRTLFFADLKPEEAKSVPWEERVGAVLEDADVPPELVRRSADFGIERVGADQYGDVLSRAPLQAAGEVGQRAQAQFEAGEAVPGSAPTNPDLREYAGPERFRPEGAPVGSLGIRDGQAGQATPIRDSLDERLQMGQTAVGAVMGAKAGDDYDDDDEDWQRAARIAGGAIGGALGGANAPNARRIFRAAMAARAFPPAREGALARAAEIGRSLAGDEAGTFGVRAKSIDPDKVPEGLDAAHVLRANQSARGESFTKNAVTPRHLVASATPEEAGAVLDFGAGDEIVHTKKLRGLGYDVTAHEFGANQVEGLHDPEALTRQYDTVYANSVVNTQSTPEMLDRTLGEIAGAVKPEGRALINYPSGPWYMKDMTPARMLEHIQQRFGSVERVGGSNSRPIWEARDPVAPTPEASEVAPEAATTARNAPKGPPTVAVPKSGELRGEELGLGDLEDPENLSRLLIDPPPGLTGEQINEIGRAAFKRLKAGNTPEQRAQQVEAERSRRLVRRQEGIQKVEAATTPEEVADAAAEADDAAKRGEIPHSDADAVRGRAARKLQQQKGEDGPPPPGEIDKQIAASRARRGADPAAAAEPAPERDPGEGVTQPLKPPPAEVWRDMGDLTDEGVTVTETPEEIARRERLRQRALEEQEGADYEGGTAPGERAVARPPALDMARAEAQSVAPLPEAGEPPAPGRGPELDPYTRTADLGQTPARVTSGSKAEAEQATAARAFARRYEGVTEPVTSPETEAAAQAVPTEPAERKIPRLVAPDGTLLTRAQAAAQLARDAARPGGWGAIRDEWNEGLSDAGKLLAAAGRGIKVNPKEMDEALAQVGGNGKGPVSGGPRVDGMSPRDREKLTKFRPEHVFDALGTMMRMNLVVTPEGFGRNLFSTTVALPLRFYEAATAPLFDRMWGVIPGQGDRGPNAAHSSEALAMAEGLYRSWAAGIANSMNVMRKGDTRLSEAQMGDASGAEADFRDTGVGKAMGTFFRPMTATDAFLKTLNEGMEAYRLSHRQARNEFDAGKLGTDARSIRSRMIEIMSTPDQKFIDQVQQAGEYNTYNQKAGHIANMLEGWKSLPKGTPPAVQGAWRLMMNVLIPFVRISTNVMKFGLERTVPGGLISTAAGKGRADRADRLAKMSEGALILGGLWGMQQAGMIEVSGALPQDPDERDEWEMQGKTPFSMRVGDRWYDPRAIPGLFENVAMLGMMTDAKRKVDDKEARGEEVGAGDFLSEIPNAIPQYLGQVGVRPAFGSVVDALGMMTASNDRDKDYHASRLKRSLVGQLAPASGAMRQIGNLTDPYQRDAQTVPEFAAAAYPFFRENLPEKLDARGAPLPSEGYEFPLAGLTSSRAAREDALLPREYLGSSDARMDAEIGSAIRAVQLYESDPRAHPRPTVTQRNLYYRFRSRKNPARQRANKAADRLDFQRKSAHADLAEEGLFEFRAPTGLLEMPDRLREMVGR